MANNILLKTAAVFAITIVFVSGGTVVYGSQEPRAVPTFNCVGLYWNAPGGSAENVCRVRYRANGAEHWKEAMPLWFDGREMSPVGRAGRGAETSGKWEHGGQYRGSIVNLQPGAQYEIKLSLEKTRERRMLKVRTWSDNFPIAKKMTVSDGDKTLVIAEGGTGDGYALYSPAKDSKTAVIDVKNQSKQCIEVRASHVILRGLTLRGAQVHAIRIFEGCHDVVIEGCDISGWGRISEDGWGENLDSAVYSNARDLRRVIVQRNRIHHPRGDSNNWREHRPKPSKREPYHPQGAQAIHFRDSEGNHVFRYNTVFSDDDHQYNDIFGAGANFSTRGFPNRDSDIYGNLLSHCWDDAIESEGANCNVRIWGNYTPDCFVSIASAGTSVGPLYVWRNISGRMRVAEGKWSGGFLKTSDIMGGGRIFVFHNTIGQPTEETEDGKISVGATTGLGWGGPMVNVTSRNNILDARSRSFRNREADLLADYDYDLYRGTLPDATRHQKHGTTGRPVYTAPGYELAPGSPGHDAGVRIPNFNDGFRDEAPDMGAQESGAEPMKFGVAGVTAGSYRQAIGPLPKPVSIERRDGFFTITRSTRIIAENEAAAEASKLADALAPAMGFVLQQATASRRSDDAIRLELSKKLARLGDEGYELDVSAEHAAIRARRPAGLFYGIQTLLQLLPPRIFSETRVEDVAWNVPCVKIVDYPRFQWRGLLVDPARHFIPKQDLMRFIDTMALHKFNSLQIHLTDDQGWRIEIKKYPILTKIGAWRDETLVGHMRDQPMRYDGKRHGGFYSHDDIRDIVRYAAGRYIRIVPEIEMPGHARGAISSYPYLGVFPEKQKELRPWTHWGVSGDIFAPRPRTIGFLQDVLLEVMELFPSEYIHIGGDEAIKNQWQASEEIQALIREKGLKDEAELQGWLVKQIDTFLTEHGRKLVGWDEILQGELAPGATVMSWRGPQGGITAANAGHDVVMAPTSHTYFDYYQGAHDKEPLAIGGDLPLAKVYSFEPVPDAVAPDKTRHILGVQGQLWGEYISTARHREYMAYPRAAALAEVAWSPKASKDYDDFLSRLRPHLARLESMGVNYRKPE